MSTISPNCSKTSARTLVFGVAIGEITPIIDQQPLYDSRGWAVTGFPYPTNEPLLYLRHGDNTERYRNSEERSHRFALEALQKMPTNKRQSIHIPEIYRVFNHLDYTYILMEYVHGKTLRSLCDDREAFEKVSQKYYDKIERALKLFLLFPATGDALPGTVGGGIIKHPLFKYFMAPIQYSSIEMLQKHMDNVARLKSSTAPSVQLEKELSFVYSDLYAGNFMFTDTRELYVMHFEQASFLPLSFMSYAMLQNHFMCGVLKERIDLTSQNIEVMRHIGSLFVMSVRKLGLPVDASPTSVQI